MSCIRKFVGDERGNVAMMFGIAVVGLIGMTGLAVEYTRGSAIQTKMAAAADAAALAAAKTTGNQGARKKVADDVFAAAMSTIPGLVNVSIDGKDVKDGPAVIGFKVTATAKMETSIGRIFGKGSIDIGTFSQATSGAGEKLEMALVLDTTGSMAGAKIDALKVAAKNLVNTLKAKAATADQLKIALVPFSQWVNVGLANRNASWLDVPADYVENKIVDVYTYPNATKSNCRIETKTWYNDGIPQTYDAEVCDWNYGTPVITPTPKTINHVWKGCVGSRNYPLNIQDGSYSTKVPGLLDHYCPGEMLPLTTDMTKVATAIDAMTAYGSTYIPSGLMWGWRVLSPGAPFAESIKGGPEKVRQALVLMTDGANTKSPQYPDHWGTDTSLANNLTTEICSAIKAAGGGIEVYTIAFDVTDNAIKDILRNCATSSVNFYDASDTTKLASAFESIATSLNALRLNK